MANEIKYVLDTSKENFIINKVKQNDDRPLILSLWDKGQAYITTGATVMLKVKKSDGTYVIQTGNITMASNIATIQMNRSITQVSGEVNLELQITKLNLNVTTFTFKIKVEPSVIQDGDLESSNSITLIEELGDRMTEALGVDSILREDIANGNTDIMREDIDNIISTQPSVIDARIGKNQKEFLPYLCFISSDISIDGLTVTFPAIRVRFWKKDIGAVLTEVDSWVHIFPENSIVDVWIDSMGVVSYELSNQFEYTSLPMHKDKLLFYRIESDTIIRNQISSTEITSSFRRALTEPYSTISNLYKYPIFTDYIIPSDTPIAWSDVAVTKGQIILENSNLWRVTTAGTLDFTPPSVVIQSVLSGTAMIEYIGMEGYENVIKLNPLSGVNWYFAHIGAGLLAKDNPEKVKKHLLATFKHVIINYSASHPYSIGMKVAGAYTSGRIWQCTKTGTSSSAFNFPSGAILGQKVTDNNITWECVRDYKTTAQYFWTDTQFNLRTKKHEDSHDSYCTMFIFALNKYIEATGDYLWLNNASGHGTLTYAQLIKEILYKNITTQIHFESGLTKTFQDDISPVTGTLAEYRFLMDNCEVYAGLVATKSVFTKLGDATYSNYITAFINSIKIAIDGLYDIDNGVFRYAYSVTEVPTDERLIFYPWIMAQGWVSLFDVPIDDYKIRNSFEWTFKKYPNWWQRMDIDSLLSLGCHYGLSKFYKNWILTKEILERIAEFQQLSNVMIISDYAFYVKTNDLLGYDVKNQINSTKEEKTLSYKTIDGSSWWRKFDDGRAECGGWLDITSSNITGCCDVTIAFPITFIGVRESIRLSANGAPSTYNQEWKAGSASAISYAVDLTAGRIIFLDVGTSYIVRCWWEAKGWYK